MADQSTMRSATRPAPIPWAMQIDALSAADPSRLARCLTRAILGCGGWVLRRGMKRNGSLNMLFEFARQDCVDVYSVLVASGLELSPIGHLRLTELCQCTRSQHRDCGADIACVDLEIQTISMDGLAVTDSSSCSA